MLRTSLRGLAAVSVVVIASLLAAALLVMGSGTTAKAAEVVTPYPSVRVEAGQDVTFDLQVHSEERELVELRVDDAPDGWTTVFRGGGSEIEAVYTDPGGAADAQIDVRIPPDAEPGSYRVAVTASGDGDDSRLPLRLRVVEQAADAYEFGTEFSTLRGSATDTFRYDVALVNNTAQEATFALNAAGPEGWDITASPSTQQKAATVTVDAGAQATVAVEADPPDSVASGSYDIAVQAQGDGATLDAALVAEVTGAASISMTTADERLNAASSAGDTGSLTLVVTNDGNAPLQGVEMSATPPSNWDVTFEPSVIETLPAGQSAQVTARISPSGDAIAGDYDVSLRAGTAEADESVSIRYAVETSNWWGLVGILVIIAALAALVLVYRRFGRR